MITQENKNKSKASIHNSRFRLLIWEKENYKWKIKKMIKTIMKLKVWRTKNNTHCIKYIRTIRKSVESTQNPIIFAWIFKNILLRHNNFLSVRHFFEVYFIETSRWRCEFWRVFRSSDSKYFFTMYVIHLKFLS